VSALWSYGFRPFFLLAALCAVVTLAVLVAGQIVGLAPDGALPLTRWHGHEMLFGFVSAAIAGFLLTAAATWTERPPLSGAPLVALVLLWLAGRTVMFPTFDLQRSPLVLLDAAFLPAVAFALARQLVPARNYRNWLFLPILALLAAADVVFHGSQLGWFDVDVDPLRFAANLVQLLVAVIGGRIIPLFTRNALARVGVDVRIEPAPRLDALALGAVVAVLVVDLLQPNGTVAASLALAASTLLAARLARWHGHRTLRMPIVWVLHAGYAWLVASLAMKGLWLLYGVVWGVNWLHALTAGAFGTMILAVMSRVALGHTGRPLTVSSATVVAYALVIGGAALRVIAPALVPDHYLAPLAVAAATWAGAFAIFAITYLPILVAPRPAAA
jgi:uncharacterized protein involved in response to NO